MDTLGIKLNVAMVQKLLFLGTARILRKSWQSKASSWPLATSCSSPERNISALRTAFAKVIKPDNNNNPKIIVCGLLQNDKSWSVCEKKYN